MMELPEYLFMCGLCLILIGGICCAVSFGLKFLLPVEQHAAAEPVYREYPSDPVAWLAELAKNRKRGNVGHPVGDCSEYFNGNQPRHSCTSHRHDAPGPAYACEHPDSLGYF